MVIGAGSSILWGSRIEFDVDPQGTASGRLNGRKIQWSKRLLVLTQKCYWFVGLSSGGNCFCSSRCLDNNNIPSAERHTMISWFTLPLPILHAANHHTGAGSFHIIYRKTHVYCIWCLTEDNLAEDTKLLFHENFCVINFFCNTGDKLEGSF